ncbi:MAG: hypothetical protein J6Y98_07255 [Bacteroidales bacterium]|nr:hypothetical protein [Bacteroidales bacterium]
MPTARNVIIIALLLCLTGRLFAQDFPGSGNPNNPMLGNETSDPDSNVAKAPEGIIYDTGIEPDSILRMRVFNFAQSYRTVKISTLSNPSFLPSYARFNNRVHNMDGNYYLDLGALGQSQLSVIPFLDERSSLVFNHTTDPFPVYNNILHRDKYFQVQNPYTVIGYGSSLNKDYQVSITHTQNIRPRWNFAFLYDLVSRDGQYTNSDITDHVLDVTTNYYSRDARYQLQAEATMTRMNQQENGGVQNDTTCWSYTRRTGAAVNMYSALNRWKNFAVNIHQSYNTMRQFMHVREIHETLYDTLPASDSNKAPEHIVPRDTIVGYDTIMPNAPHTYNTGVFALDLSYSRHRRFFYDNQVDSAYYNLTSINTSTYFDSTSHHQLAAELYWTNDAYMSHRWKNPFVILFGVRPEYNKVQYLGTGNAIDEFSLSPFAKTTIQIGAFQLHANAEEVNSSRRGGDYRLCGDIEIAFGHHSTASAEVLSEAQSPNLIFYHNEGAYNWHYDDFNKIKRQSIALNYNYAKPDSLIGRKGFAIKRAKINLASNLLSDNIWINDAMLPMQSNATALLLQANASTHLKMGWLNIALQESLQWSSDNDVIRVPLLASKNSVYADVHLFHRALHLQTGFDLRFHTSFYADAWNPILGTFYRQNEREVGGYLVADFWITMQVKRASIYLKASHFNAPIDEFIMERPNYFSLPHYPMEDFGLYWGIIWKFFD